jgi:hypothetical protein
LIIFKVGEGEATLLDLLDHLEREGAPSGASTIADLGIRNGSQVRFTEVRPQLSDLDYCRYLT